MTKRTTGRLETVHIGGRDLQAFVPHPLPPSSPALAIGPRLRDKLVRAEHALARAQLAADVLSASPWLADVLARREAVMSTRLAGVAARVDDLVASEADEFAIPSGEVADARRALDAMGYARRFLDPRGSSISPRALCELHRVLARGDENAGRIRQSALWIGANRPEGAVFVPPPPQSIAELLSSLERFVADDRDLPPIVRAGLVHVQLASIHPFSDGNGRLARLLVPVLLERWGALGRPVLCASSFLRDHSREYYRRVDAVRSAGDWEGYTEFFLDAVAGAAEDSVGTMRNIASLIATDRTRVLQSAALSAAALRLFELLPARPIVTIAAAITLLGASKPTAGRAIEALVEAGVLRETTGKKRDRWFAYAGFLETIEVG